MAKDKLKEAEYKAEGVRRIAKRNAWRRKIYGVKLNERAKFREWERERDWY